MARNKKAIAQLWGREIDIVKQGLSQSQVYDCIAELINQNKALTDKIKRLNSICDRLLPHLGNLIAVIGATGEEMEQARLGAVEENELKTLSLSIPISEVGNNGAKESLEVQEDLESEFATMGVNKSQTAEEGSTDSADKLATPYFTLNDSAPIEGEVWIIVSPPVDMAQLIRFRRDLQDVSHLKILRTSGSWNGGSVITILLDRPLPLISLLKEMPEVENAELWTVEKEWADGNLPWESVLEPKPGSWQEKIVVTFNHSEVK